MKDTGARLVILRFVSSCRRDDRTKNKNNRNRTTWTREQWLLRLHGRTTRRGAFKPFGEITTWRRVTTNDRHPFHSTTGRPVQNCATVAHASYTSRKSMSLVSYVTSSDRLTTRRAMAKQMNQRLTMTGERSEKTFERSGEAEIYSSNG